MSETALIGKAKELYVATLLVGRRLHVYFPLVDNGFDLIVSKPDGSEFLPVQVKYKAERTGFSLKRCDAIRFSKVGAVLAFGSEAAREDHFYFFPAADWMKRATEQDRHRGDDRLVAYINGDGWEKPYLGEMGINLAFARVLRTEPNTVADCL